MPTRLVLQMLLLLYPQRFRRVYSAEIEDVLAARLRDVRTRRGALSVAGVWLRTMVDIAAGAAGERWRSKKFKRVALGDTSGKRGDSMWRSILQDARLALRTLRRQPGFAVVAIGTLAIGIGANTAIFSMVNNILLEPLPFAHPSELVRIWSNQPAEDRDRYFSAPLSYWEWKDRATSLTDIAAVWSREVTLTDEVSNPARLRTMSVTANWFSVLGVVPLQGRLLQPNDADITWGAWVVVLTHGMWQERFGADPQVVGTSVRIDGQPAEIIGVLPPGGAFPETADIFTNFQPPRTQPAMYLDVIARMRPGTTVETAHTELQRVAHGLATEFPNVLEGWGVDMAPLHEVVVGDVRPVLITLLAATALVLAIACANVANLLLSRTEQRSNELSVRAALGAGRGRLVRQMLTEGVVLGGIGALVGVVLAFVGLRVLVGLLPADLPRFDGVGIDHVMLVAALASALLTGLVFGLAPAYHALGIKRDSGRQSAGQRSTSGLRSVQARDALVIFQMTLAVVVSVGAGLLMKSFSNLRSTDPGFDPGGALTFELNLPPGPYPDLTRVRDTYGEILDAIASVPGVVLAGATSSLPLSEPLDYLLTLSVVGGEPPQENREPTAWYRQVSSGFFESAGIPLIRGRDFDDGDQSDSPGVVIVNRSLATSLFGEENPVGRRLRGISGGFGPLGYILNNETEIVGIVDDVRYGSLRDAAAPSLYFPIEQAPFRRMTIVVRTTDQQSGTIAGVRRVVSDIDPNLPLVNVQTMQDTVDRSIARDRFAMMLVTLFGVVALTLAAVGIYGVLSYSIAQRTREFGLRIALGATSGRVFGLVAQRTAVLVGTGILLGLVGSIAATRAIANQLVGVTSSDPLTFVGVTIVLGVVGFLASYLPARRATRISPVTALKE